ncbi:SRPBCC domain-containing protein [Tsukamurella soli]|uniref:SRPBCC domain-containing protein n=1 Tax=Tsukamurella soli TaxID=644556 RepID=A0ABP8KAE6_9ACTN
MTGSRVIVALRVPATPTRAFAAFTEGIAQWWQPNGLFQFAIGRTGTLVFEPGPTGRLVETYPGGDLVEIGRVRVWDPPRRLVLGWRQAGFAPDEQTELRVTFDDVSTGAAPCTRVTVEHIGWDTIAASGAARHGFPLRELQLRFAQWWRLLLGGLGEVADPATRTNPR